MQFCKMVLFIICTCFYVSLLDLHILSPLAPPLLSPFPSISLPFLSPVTHILRLTLNWACEVCFYIIGLFKELALREFPGGPLVRTLVLPLLRAQVLSLVGELRSQMPHSVGKK